MFLAGVVLTIGAPATFKFFTKSRNYQGSAFFFGGFAAVMLGWPMVGMGLEGYGFFKLFAGFAPTALHFLRKLPVLNKVFDSPVVKSVINRVAPPDSLPV